MVYLDVLDVLYTSYVESTLQHSLLKHLKSYCKDYFSTFLKYMCNQWIINVENLFSVHKSFVKMHLLLNYFHIGYIYFDTQYLHIYFILKMCKRIKLVIRNAHIGLSGDFIFYSLKSGRQVQSPGFCLCFYITFSAPVQLKQIYCNAELCYVGGGRLVSIGLVYNFVSFICHLYCCSTL